MLSIPTACLAVVALFVGKAVARPIYLPLTGVVEQQGTSESFLHKAADHHAYAHATAIDPEQVVAPAVADIMHTNHMLYRRFIHVYSYTADEVSAMHTKAANAHIAARRTWGNKVPGSKAKQDAHTSMVTHHDDIAGQVLVGEHADNLNVLHQQAVDSIADAEESKKQAEARAKARAKAAKEAEAARQAGRQAERGRRGTSEDRAHKPHA